MRTGLDVTIRAAMNVLQRALDIRRVTRKEDDYLWARCSRPQAALLLALLHRLPVTPNFYTMVSLAVGLVAAVLFAILPGHRGLLIAWGVCHLAYLFDCMDGMLARYRGLRSPVGLTFDYLADEIKQVALFPALAIRLSFAPGAGWAAPFPCLPGLSGPEGWLLIAALSGPLVSAPLAMTALMRSPAYTGEAEHRRRPPRKGGLTGLCLRAVSFLLNYPSWILLPVLLDRIDLFLFVSLPLYGLYSAYNLVLIARKLVPFTHYAGHADAPPAESPPRSSDAP